MANRKPEGNYKLLLPVLKVQLQKASVRKENEPGKNWFWDFLCRLFNGEYDESHDGSQGETKTNNDPDKENSKKGITKDDYHIAMSKIANILCKNLVPDKKEIPASFQEQVTLYVSEWFAHGQVEDPKLQSIFKAAKVLNESADSRSSCSLFPEEDHIGSDASHSGQQYVASQCKRPAQTESDVVSAKKTYCENLSSEDDESCSQSFLNPVRKQTFATDVNVTGTEDNYAYRRELRSGFTELSGLMPTSHLVNLIGVVADLTTPLKSRGSDFYMKIYVVDPSSSNASCEIMWFESMLSAMPNVYRGGEIIICERVKCQQYQGALQLLKNKCTAITVIPRDDDPDVMKAARLPNQRYDGRLTRAINVLRNWSVKHADLFEGITFVKIESLETPSTVNICVQLCKMVYVDLKVILTVTDGSLAPVKAHRDPSEKEKPAVQRVVFDDTGQFEKDRLVEITMKGNFAKKDQIKGFNLKKGTVLVMYGVTVKESKYGRMKLVLKETGVCPQGYAVVKPERYQETPLPEYRFNFKRF